MDTINEVSELRRTINRTGVKVFVPVSGPMEYEVQVTKVDALVLVKYAVSNDFRVHGVLDDADLVIYFDEGDDS